MGEGAYEIICNGCRSAVSSAAAVCPNCGAGLIREESAEPQPQARLSKEVVPAEPETASVASAWNALRSFDEPRVLEAGDYGGFWIRVGAYGIDWLVLLLPAIALRQTIAGPTASLITLVGTWLYFALMESSGSQGTLGKIAFGLAVTDAGGRRISFGRATGRYFAKILSAIPLGIGFIMVGWTHRKRGLHDFVADTLVVRR